MSIMNRIKQTLKYSQYSLLALLVGAPLTANANPEFITDLATQTIVQSASSNPTDYIEANGLLFFRIFKEQSGGGFAEELWATDGKDTWLVKDIGAVSHISTLDNFTVLGNSLYFVTVGTRTELWKSDGSSAGTVLIKPVTDNADNFVRVDNQFYFSANENTELWQSNGTTAGTTLIKSFTHIVGSNYIIVDDLLYFTADDGVHGEELWKSDGTNAGTVLVKDIFSGVDSSKPLQFEAIENTLFFSAIDTTHGRELWKSNGTTAGTVLVEDINPGAESGVAGNKKMAIIDTTLYFAATDGIHGGELWKTDGINTSLMDINVGIGDSFPDHLTALGNTLYFQAFTDEEGEVLWKTDGTDVFRVQGTSGSHSFLHPGRLTVVGDTLYFSLDDFSALWKTKGAGATRAVESTPHANNIIPIISIGNTLYFKATFDHLIEHQPAMLGMTDGTIASTVMLTNNNPLTYGGSLGTLNGSVYFTADDGVHGRELWKNDGINTTLVANIQPEPALATASSGVNEFAEVNGVTFFVDRQKQARGSATKNTLWANDGTNSRQVVRGIPDNYSYNMTTVGDTLYFQSYYAGHGNELWKSDGVTETLVKDINPTGDSNPHQFVAVNDTLYFGADDGIHGHGLWNTNGTANGTVLVKAIIPRSTGLRRFDRLISLTVVGNTLYFFADDGVHGQELWKSDGTTAGTVLVKDIRTGGNSGVGSRTSIVPVNDTLFFGADDGVHGPELWKSDGTAAGTVLVKDIDSRTDSSGEPFGGYPSDLTAAGNTLYFTASDEDHGRELWKSDGTAAGTLLIKDIIPGIDNNGSPKSSSIWNLTATDDTLYFITAVYPYNNNDSRLWKTDGTNAGTMVVTEVNPAGPFNLVTIDSTLYFSAYNDAFGHEIWKSDGTESGTELAFDLVPGIGGSNPQYLTAIGNTLYFTANDGVTGQEPWKFETAAIINPVHDFSLQVSINTQSTDKPGPTLNVGDTVNWTYTVTNTGNTPLSNIAVSGRQKLPTFSQWEDLCTIVRIPVGEAASCQSASNAVDGVYKSLIRATENSAAVTALADAFYQGQTGGGSGSPGLAMTVTANNQTVGKPGPAIAAGEAVNWVYTLSNTGNTTLSNLEVRARQKLPDLGSWETLCAIAEISAGQTASCSSASTAIEGIYKSLVVARDNRSVETLADAFYKGNEQPAIEDPLVVSATANNQPTAKPGPVFQTSEAINWAYTVTNNGQSTLNNVEVRGRQKLPTLGRWGILCSIPQIPAGESRSCRHQEAAIDGVYKRLLSVSVSGNQASTIVFYQ